MLLSMASLSIAEQHRAERPLRLARKRYAGLRRDTDAAVRDPLAWQHQILNYISEPQDKCGPTAYYHISLDPILQDVRVHYSKQTRISPMTSGWQRSAALSHFPPSSRRFLCRHVLVRSRPLGCRWLCVPGQSDARKLASVDVEDAFADAPQPAALEEARRA